MIVMSRMKGESILIGEGDRQVQVEIIEIRGDKVRLGIAVPGTMSLHRKEIWDAIRREGDAQITQRPM